MTASGASSELGVVGTILSAIASGTHVGLVMAAPPGLTVLEFADERTSGIVARVIEGRPVGFRATADGRPRVVLVVKEGECEQLVLLDRIVRVVVHEPA
jgi:hypothetical protein